MTMRIAHALFLVMFAAWQSACGAWSTNVPVPVEPDEGFSGRRQSVINEMLWAVQERAAVFNRQTPIFTVAVRDYIGSAVVTNTYTNTAFPGYYAKALHEIDEWIYDVTEITTYEYDNTAFLCPASATGSPSWYSFLSNSVYSVYCSTGTMICTVTGQYYYAKEGYYTHSEWSTNGGYQYYFKKTSNILYEIGAGDLCVTSRYISHVRPTEVFNKALTAVPKNRMPDKLPLAAFTFSVCGECDNDQQIATIPAQICFTNSTGGVLDKCWWHGGNTTIDGETYPVYYSYSSPPLCVILRTADLDWGSGVYVFEMYGGIPPPNIDSWVRSYYIGDISIGGSYACSSNKNYPYYKDIKCVISGDSQTTWAAWSMLPLNAMGSSEVVPEYTTNPLTYYWEVVGTNIDEHPYFEWSPQYSNALLYMPYGGTVSGITELIIESSIALSKNAGGSGSCPTDKILALRAGDTNNNVHEWATGAGYILLDTCTNIPGSLSDTNFVADSKIGTTLLFGWTNPPGLVFLPPRLRDYDTDATHPFFEGAAWNIDTANEGLRQRVELLNLLKYTRFEPAESGSGNVDVDLEVQRIHISDTDGENYCSFLTNIINHLFVTSPILCQVPYGLTNLFVGKTNCDCAVSEIILNDHVLIPDYFVAERADVPINVSEWPFEFVWRTNYGVMQYSSTSTNDAETLVTNGIYYYRAHTPVPPTNVPFDVSYFSVTSSVYYDGHHYTSTPPCGMATVWIKGVQHSTNPLAMWRDAAYKGALLWTFTHE